jgi:beta-mannosidase
VTFETVTTSVPRSRSISAGWTVEAIGGVVPDSLLGKTIEATVPGSVHTDLLAAGLILDPYLDDHERLEAWIGSADWRYSTEFEWRDSGFTHGELVFQGLDTVAQIELNGTPIGSTANMHRTYRFDVRPLLREGSNHLVVTFSSPIKYADLASLELGYRPHVNHHPYNAIRKMACSFGWDWGLDTATVGIWRPVSLEEWSAARLSAVRPTAEVLGSSGVLTVRAEVEGNAEDLHVRVSIDGLSVVSPIESGTTVASAELDAVRLWWPRGFGAQELYAVVVELVSVSEVIDTWTGTVGFRTVRLDTTVDSTGNSMGFVINDQPVFVRGANWIPDDAFPHRVTRDRYEQRIGQAVSANINLLRVWGGGTYESDDFFQLCDTHGVMVWQDFLFACAAYAEEEPMWSEVEAEARDNVSRIMPHPSLIIWNGSNENFEGYHEWGWQSRLQGRTWGSGYYDRLLPSIVNELDPGRVYIPSSPWSPNGSSRPNDPDHGSMHIWDMWNRADYLEYRSKAPRFVAEFGWQGPPTWSTMRSSVTDNPLTPESPGMLVHQKAVGGNDKLTDGLVPHFPFPDDMEDWHWAMSLNQATAVRVGIEHLRSLGPHCSGAIVWQLNDCWPVTSWSAIDGYGRAKPLLYSIGQAYADQLVTIQPRGEELAAIIVNDSSDSIDGEIQLNRVRFDGAVRASTSVSVVVPPRSSLTVPIPKYIASTQSTADEVVLASIGDLRGTWFFAEYKDSALGPAHLTSNCKTTASGYQISVTAETLVRDLALLVDKVDGDAVVDTMLITLLPGETATFTVRSRAKLDPNAFLSPRVLRSANDLLTSGHP